MMRKILLFLTPTLFYLLTFPFGTEAKKLRVVESKVSFKSDAPLEIIEAESTQLRGIIDTDKKKFGFKINMNTFVGFNSALQLEHYNENYIETDKYPQAQFFGTFIDLIDFEKAGIYSLRASGKFTLHGVTKEKIFLGQVQVHKNGTLTLNTKIDLALSDFGIEVPRIVHHKIADVIQVNIQCAFEKI